MCCDFGKANLTPSPRATHRGAALLSLSRYAVAWRDKVFTPRTGHDHQSRAKFVREQGVAHVQSFSPPILSDTKTKRSTHPEPAKQKTSDRHKMWWIYSLIRSRLSQSVLLSAREERQRDDDQLVLFPELAEAPPPAQTEVTPMQPQSSPRPGIGHRLPGRGCRGQQFPEQRRADNSSSLGE